MFARLGWPIVTDFAESATLLALTQAAAAARIRWYELSDLLEVAGSASGIADGTAPFYDQREAAIASSLRDHLTPAMEKEWAATLATVLGDGESRLVTVLDDEYPANLRRIYNRPPFLFVRGRLDVVHERAVAVVGTRRASEEGRVQAAQLATELVRRGVTVVSGLAAGIDTAAHTGALDAGGNTVAVMGTGIDRVYPRDNEALAARIPANGALVSQFWPGSPPRAEHFPLRNVVSSGIAMGTVVVEASGRSGARMQARLALEHGKRLFLVEPLVLHEDWARDYARRPGATVVSSAEDVVRVLEAEKVVERASQTTLF